MRLPLAICRFRLRGPGGTGESIRTGVVGEGARILEVTAGLGSLEQILESADPVSVVRSAIAGGGPEHALEGVELLAPVERQEVWAAGVTYLRSKAARMEESDFSATAYDRVYEAERPELFFKSLAEKVVGPDAPVGIRRDARWSVPEPELALVVNSRGELVGFTIGNDMSSRDIEGENLLYLPQAKIYRHSCALGPWVVLGVDEAVARGWRISIQITRGSSGQAFAGETVISQIRRSFGELIRFLYRSQAFPHGAVLLTGTGVVPPDGFSLAAGDVVRIEVDGIGSLSNPVTVV